MQLEVRDLSKVYPLKRGLLPITFSVSKGELIAVVGHNGAGKSTLLKLLANAIVPDSGQVSIEGIPLARRAEIVKLVGYVPETPNLYDSFSVEYNLRLFSRLFGCESRKIVEMLTEFDLLAFRRTPVLNLSKGLKQRVNIARSLLSDPSILLLDEPTSGLDFDMTNEMYRLIRRVNEQGKTILFTSHRPEEVKSLATRILVVHQGTLVFDGTNDAYYSSGFHEKLYV